MRLRLTALALLLGLVSAPLIAQEAWLVTYGPGNDVWERFGHNALWIRDEERGIDHSFSFGYFELDRPGFHQDFARGIMLYFGAASSPEREFAFYRQRQRSIDLQLLSLNPAQVRELYHLLSDAIFPHPQYYQYDYYLANCSTWLRDLIDQVVGGQLAQQLENQPARLNFRDHTRRLTAERFWMHTGMMLLLGPKIDQPRTAWEETFLPEALAAWLDTVEVDGEPLVVERQSVYASDAFTPPDRAAGPWLASLLLGLASTLLVLLSGWRGQGALRLLPWRFGLLIAGLAGLAALSMWLLSGHVATWRNLMLLVINPLWLMFLLPGMIGVKRICIWLMVIMVVVGTALMAWPDGPQYRLDQLLWLTPLSLALLLVAHWRLNWLESSQ